MNSSPIDIMDFRNRISASWMGEPGGGPGPTTEFYDKLGREIVDLENQLMIKAGKAFKPSPLATFVPNFYNILRTVGAYIANALIHKKVLGVSFSHITLSAISGNELKADDLKIEDEQLY